MRKILLLDCNTCKVGCLLFAVLAVKLLLLCCLSVRLLFLQGCSLLVMCLISSDHKPPIAHTDMKSPNILMKSFNPNETCAKIADFGTSQFVLRPLTKSLVENPVWQGIYIKDATPNNKQNSV